jgi:preprotein translocase subunit SecE
MGRLLKKKDTTKKKKKDAEANADAAAVTTDAPAGGKHSAVTGEGKKRPVPPPQKKGSGATKAAGEKNIFGKSIQFLREVRAELKKVTWPSRKQTLGSTAVVIVLVMIISLYLGLVDAGLSSLVRIVLP